MQYPGSRVKPSLLHVVIEIINAGADIESPAGGVLNINTLTFRSRNPAFKSTAEVAAIVQ